MDYLDFDLLIEPSGEFYRTRAWSEQAGEAAADFKLPFSADEIQDFSSIVGRQREEKQSTAPTEMQAIKAFGSRLFEAVFRDKVRDCLLRSLHDADIKKGGLRLRIRLNDTPALASLPWEYLYNTSLNCFFSHSIETPIVRYLELPVRIQPLAVEPPLKVLVIISCPLDQPALAVEQEWKKLNETLGELVNAGKVTAERLENPSLTKLHEQLHRKQYHIIHFIGHGSFDENTKEGSLILENEDGQSQYVDCHRLGTLLHDHRTSLRLALLNACESARGARTDIFAGIAQSLVQQGIPAVIAMQSKITDMAAITLTQNFYNSLSRGLPVDAALAQTRRAIYLEGNDIEWGTPVLYMRTPDGKIFDIEQPNKPDIPKRARIFISYKRKADLDQKVALQIYQALSQQHEVFIDQSMVVGTHWVERIMMELHQADFLITLLSAQAIHSEMLKEEIATAHHLGKAQNGRPVILPVRLAYREPFQYPLNEYLDHINWAIWENEQDTPRLIDELKKAIAGGALSISEQSAKVKVLRSVPEQVVPPPFSQAQPPRLEMPGGAMDPQSIFYIERAVDRVALESISQEERGETITIKAPRQMGKSSLLIRSILAARLAGKRVAFLDFQFFDKLILHNAENFYRQFCAAITKELKIPDRVDELWNADLGNNMNCSQYLEYVLNEVNGPLVLAMDEADSLLGAGFCSDFFGMLRGWHNKRALDPLLRKLSLALVISTEPFQLIDNPNQSPFNVGLVIELADFVPEQVATLNRLHGSPLNSSQLQQLIRLLNGHPYLVRRALYLLASNHLSPTEFFSLASDDRGPFGDHLRHHLFRLHGKNDLVQGLQQIIQKHSCKDELICYRLQAAGLARKEGNTVLPRCQLYADYFRERLHG